MGEQPRYLLVIHACTVRTMEVHTGPRKGVRRRAWWYTIRSTTTGLTFLPDVGGKRPGRGACFSFTLPIERASRAA